MEHAASPARPGLVPRARVSLSVLAQAVLAVFGLFLVGLAMVAFAKPAIAERFFTAFASSAATHYTEQAFRLLIGVSLIVHAPAMWQDGVFRIIGWMIVVTSLGLLVTPWRWHYRFGQRVMPLMLWHLRLYAIGLMAFGILLLLGVFWGKQRVAAWSTATSPAAAAMVGVELVLGTRLVQAPLPGDRAEGPPRGRRR